MKTILIVDDEPGIRSVLSDIISDEGYEPVCAADGLECFSRLQERRIDLVILDVWLPQMGGMDVLEKIKEGYPTIEVIVISGHGNIDLAVKAVKLGAFDFLEKPLSLERVITLIKNALVLANLKDENRSLKAGLAKEDRMVGSSPALAEVRERIRQSAATDVKILITGENGTGKELVAREIHRGSRRAHRPFVQVNCAALPDTLLESELFGHEKGSFTGAVSRRRGKFEVAHGGTLFLDEIADMSLNAQAKILRVIQEMRFERVGGEESITVDVRLLAATNKDILREIREGRFREDLYFRLNVVPIAVPALRQRREDLPLLADYFFARFTPPAEKNTRRLSPGALELLMEYPWPGNIREFKNFIERVVVMSDEEEISRPTAEYFLGEAGDKTGTPSGAGAEEIPGAPDFSLFDGMRLGEAREAFETALIRRRLAKFNQNISKTAQDLGIYPSNLHGKINKLRIEINPSRRRAEPMNSEG
ncbi:MAG: sigma-54 dependent transcriptional regulator [Spirochaetales bacterium]|nr:sigma-54 dependent transcriptional regulator [Spirochaetales bacterium]